MAGTRPNRTLGTISLAHVACLKLVCPPRREGGWTSKAHFFLATAEAMRRMLIDHARGELRDRKNESTVAHASAHRSAYLLLKLTHFSPAHANSGEFPIPLRGSDSEHHEVVVGRSDRDTCPVVDYERVELSEFEAIHVRDERDTPLPRSLSTNRILGDSVARPWPSLPRA